MLQRLIETGFLKAQAPEPKHDQWKLADHNASVLKISDSLTVAIEIIPTVEKSELLKWLRKATLILAAYEGGQDCSLQLQDEKWLLWRFYDDNVDENELSQGVVMHLAIAKYLEKGFKEKKNHKRDFVMRMRT
ncbi:hypothetical protein D5R81_02975 [Parashewanella spongiae]|uniref:Uncharacterized protein n=1 Tax=Parashewanella spongiae TaxID=342950 RepID=A0A3A6UMF6_9GAMM|nr:hypothetical protein [Parashewanella spongiae]MCL1076970.1 hypothetical protein [Parashewanella spongiae]RJY18914.1 hypothetical protein D5R81_02975 [Parashewanella spongiae]